MQVKCGMNCYGFGNIFLAGLGSSDSTSYFRQESAGNRRSTEQEIALSFLAIFSSLASPGFMNKMTARNATLVRRGSSKLRQICYTTCQ